MNAGKHVVCEKPLAVNEKEAQELVDLARAPRPASGRSRSCGALERSRPWCYQAFARVILRKLKRPSGIPSDADASASAVRCRLWLDDGMTG